MNNKPQKIKATLKLKVTAELYDDDATEETLRYLVEQSLEEAGFDVDVTVFENLCYARRALKETYCCGNCGKEFPATHRKIRFCPFCGTKVEWSRALAFI